MKNPRIYGKPPYRVALVHGGPGATGEMAVVALHGDYDPHPITGVELPLSTRLNNFRLIALDKYGHKP